MIWKYSILHSKTVCSFPSAVLIEAFHLLVNFSNCWLTKVTSVREMRKVYELRKEEDFRKRFSINLWWSCQERFSLDKSIKAKQHTVEKRRHSAAAGWWHLTNLFFFSKAWIRAYEISHTGNTIRTYHLLAARWYNKVSTAFLECIIQWGVQYQI